MTGGSWPARHEAYSRTRPGGWLKLPGVDSTTVLEATGMVSSPKLTWVNKDGEWVEGQKTAAARSVKPLHPGQPRRNNA